jgi:hypothetical protein
MSELTTKEALQAAVRQAVAEVTITDIHTHLFPPNHGDLLLWGVDELLTYHYLVAEFFTVAPTSITPEAFWQMPKAAQADLIWEHVFLKHGALSEAARGVITTLNKLGLDVAGRDLAGVRKWFAAQNVDDYLDKAFELAGLNYAVMTNDPFQAAEVEQWRAGKGTTDRLKTALRIDPLLMDWQAAAAKIKDSGYDLGADEPASFAAARRFLIDWAKKLSPLYLAASLPPSFIYPGYGTCERVLDNVVLPVARELGIPMAMMIGVYKNVNPRLGLGGDAVGVADVPAVTALCSRHDDVKFLVTMLSRVNQHELCVAARKFGNLHLFGCWWFCNDPSIIDEMTRQRLELLGATFTCQHSDARVLDQVIYKWSHTRPIIANVLADKYGDLFDAGWRPTRKELARDVRGLFGGMFEEFCAK